MANIEYHSIIEQAINDFDAIQGVLRDKGITYKGEALKADTTGVATSEYAGLINHQLYRVGDKEDLKNGLTGSKITDLTSATLAPSGALAISNTDLSNFTISFAPDKAGFIDGSGDNGTRVSVTLGSSVLQNPVLSATATLSAGTGTVTPITKEDSEEVTSYRVTADANKILGSVTIPAGSASIPDPTITHTATVAPSVEINSADTAGITSKLLDATGYGALAADNQKNYVQIQFVPKAKYEDTVTATITPKITGGFIKGFDNTNLNETGSIVVKDETNKNKNVEGASTSFYLPKGSVNKVSLTSSGLSFNKDGDQSIFAAADAEEGSYYPIIADVENLNIDANESQITEGWISGGSLSIDASSAKITGSTKIKKGSLTSGSVTLTPKITDDTNTILTPDVADEKLSDYYNITVSAGTLNADGNEGTTDGKATFAEGYIKSADADETVHAVFPTQKLHVKKGSVSAAINADKTATFVNYGTNTVITKSLGTTDKAADYYEIDPSLTATITPSFTEGYIKNFPTPDTYTGALDPFYIKKGHVKFRHDLLITPPTGTAVSSIFSETAPSDGTEYFTIATNGTFDKDATKAGYITTEDVEDDEDKKYYIPKAKFEFVKDSTGNSIIQATTSGYIPSGVIQAVEGKIDEAVVSANLDTGTTNIISSGASAADDYVINIEKNMTTTDAGYISSSEGTLQLASKYFIKRGKLDLSASLGNIVADAKGVTYSETNGNYSIGVSTSGEVAISTSSVYGYVASSDDLTLHSGKATGTVTLPSVTLRSTENTKAKAGVDLGDLEAGISTADGYVINPTYTAAKYTVDIATAGYGAVGRENTVVTSDADLTPIYIKKGAAVTKTGSQQTISEIQTSISNSLNATSTGDYTFSVAKNISDSVTIPDAYYKGQTASITVPVNISGTIKHGKAKVNIDNISTDVTLGGMSEVTGEETSTNPTHFYTVGGTVTSASISLSNVVAGYMKEADIDVTDTTASTSATKKHHIQKYEFAGDPGSNGTGVATVTDSSSGTAVTYFIPYGNDATTGVFGTDTAGIGTDEKDTLILHTKASYAANDIKLTLNQNAMGKEVRDDITRLTNRLKGNLVKASA